MAVLPLMEMAELVGTPTGHVIVGAETVPDGVPAPTLDVVSLAPVKGSAGTVPALPLKSCAAAVSVATVGVIVFAPPVVPTSPCAARVPSGTEASSAATWE